MEEFAKSICFDLGRMLQKASQDKTVLSSTPLFIKSPYWERTIRFDLIAMFPHLLYFKSYWYISHHKQAVFVLSSRFTSQLHCLPHNELTRLMGPH